MLAVDSLLDDLELFSIPVLIVLIKVLVVFVVGLVGTMLMVWFERKVIAFMQNRIGPDKAGPKESNGCQLVSRQGASIQLVQPLRFAISSQSPKSDAHVYGGRSRFMTEKVLRTLEETVFHGTHLAEAGLVSDAAPEMLDVTSRVKQMW